ncbi:MAG TPA: hemerythrin domain-containing protein [Gammaproteobacteria bacterium]|nr:hemerythrin domain-containing protein [Gammaproteobacteria bacterium]
MSFQETLTAQHRACDAEFAKIEQAVHRKDWAAAMSTVQAFVDDTESHFRYEEHTLFPALEAVAPMAAGPISVMRSEHAQMRELFGELQAAIGRRDVREVIDAAETLFLVMQQHNVKEENVLYPMADRTVAHDLMVRLEGRKGVA